MENVNFTHIEGKPCRVMWSMRDPNRRKLGIGNLFIKNIEPMLDSKALYQGFSTFGPVLSCKIAVDEYGLSKGYGFIQFYNEKDAENARIRSNGVIFMKKKLVVTKFIPKSARTDAKPVNPNEYTNVFVKNFGLEWTHEDLKNAFSKFGEITSCLIQKDQQDKSLGFGFVNFATHQSAAEAVKVMNGFELPNGLKLFASKAMKKLERQAFLKKQYEQKKKEYYKQFQNLNLYVKNFDESISDEKLGELFAPYGKIKSSHVMKDDAGKSKGFGFVCFETLEEAAAALHNMNSKVLDTKPLYVAYAQSREERRKALEQQTYNGGFRPQIFPAGSVPFMYPHPGGVPYPHPSQFQRFSNPGSGRPQGRAMQSHVPHPNQGYPQPGPRQNFGYAQSGSYMQQNYRPRSNMPMSRNPQSGNSYGQRPQQVSMNHIVSENVPRPKRDEFRPSLKPSVSDSMTVFKDRFHVVCQAHFHRMNYNMDWLTAISDLLMEHFTNSHSTSKISDKEIEDAINNVYEDYAAKYAKPQ
ncbi:hypothetical protein HZS_5507 [Henneguya salminicola]|nr:hypothetical protein HZS_5507 [Henneguya salminicola]